ncbi:protein IQ-DOMAIN 31 isoform X1 [Brachypodium distachyon]|uniref:DUF4005 domain-containing protein n=1 Tax=Brachypodium distachyon TaxID=15368 RepID=I1HQY6_BRADI|nr:protein IQ-DOMAIN 31 isoform X1 [Brachypodium distachyon]XP_010232232.1 protein IQ-DOMAIN 31 isoform X1 [Brachypodium distachyon]XP_014755274.1 protein IQ-DOMAIN 31 isoform X1 [Brachypodium distachyon]KQK09473.1 hypothetical protein BRADI_2g48210v3 [Brachypodium distachyon]KQK09474.1 hypothetical protein BRADI_2g48210v3 [Brachypodium distachyon]KQK09476.1 hypothetical protein BRADI_2g48210v3 [Brachypodium distachyon]KQK09478.1 hypothetical protein BRADI_2g48210v3 [Brachypodium distachyon]|eukprot:XP_003569684.1 protein IQ-DOMAIN 31 isoform X1 [Brachypodium distachyon]
MGKSPAKWIKSVLLGKKSAKSNSIKKAANGNSYPAGKEAAFPDNSPVISDPVLVSSHNNGAASNLTNGRAVETMVQIELDMPVSPEKLREELAAVKAQAAFRGYLARRAFRALKGIIRLQALIRGHLVRRQAVSTLRATWLIVKFQALVRGRNVRLSSADLPFVKLGQHKLGSAKSSDAWKEKLSSNAYVRKLLSAPVLAQALRFQYDERDPNSAYNWFERWTISCIWKAVSLPKRVADGKPQGRKTSYAMETKSAKLKRNVRKSSAATGETQTNMTPEPEKPKRNPRKFSSSPADSVPDSQLSELEKVKRNLKKAANSMAEASKISNSMAEASKVPNPKAHASKVSNSVADVPKVSNSMVEASKMPSLVNGISDHQDDQCEKALQSAFDASFPPETQDSHSGNLLDNSNVDTLVRDIEHDLETPFSPALIGEKVNEPNIVAQSDEVMLLQNIANKDGKKEQTRDKEEPLSNGNLRTSKRRSSFSNSGYPESGTKTTPVPARQPSYMAATESLKAKLRGPPILDYDSPVDKNSFTRRQSLPSAANNRGIKVEWRR